MEIFNPDLLIREEILKTTNKFTIKKVFTIQEECLFCKSYKCNFSLEKNKKLQEVSIISRLRNPNVSKFRGAFFTETSESSYLNILTNYYTQGDLKCWIINKRENSSDCSYSEAVLIIKQLLSSVSYLHENKIIHRDLKPENIMLKNQDGQLFLVVCDFGSAKLTDQENTSLKLSYAYASPELKQAYDNRESREIIYDGMKSDSYSLGLVILQSLTLTEMSLTEISAGSSPDTFDQIENIPKRFQPFKNILNGLLDSNEYSRKSVKSAFDEFRNLGITCDFCGETVIFYKMKNHLEYFICENCVSKLDPFPNIVRFVRKLLMLICLVAVISKDVPIAKISMIPA